MLAIEARHGAKMGPEGGSTQASATEALLLPGPRLKIEGDHAPIWRQDGPRRGVNPGQSIGGALCAVGAGGPVGPRKAKIRASALVRAGLAPLRGGPWAKIGGRCWQ